MAKNSKSPARFLESAANGGRYYELVKVYDPKGEALDRNGRRYTVKKVIVTRRVLGAES